MHKYGITDLTCAPYMANGPHWTAETPCYELMCRTCGRVYDICKPINESLYTKYYVDEVDVSYPSKKCQFFFFSLVRLRAWMFMV